MAILPCFFGVEDREVLADDFVGLVPLESLRASVPGRDTAIAIEHEDCVVGDVIHENLKSAVHAPVVQIEAESPDFERLSTALMLAGVDPRTQHVQDLIVAPEQGAAEDLRIAAVYGGLNR